MQNSAEFYATLSEVKDNGSILDPLPYYKMLVEQLIGLLDKKYEVINTCIEIFLLLSYLSNQNEVFKNILEKSDKFMKIIQKIINTYAVSYIN